MANKLRTAIQWLSDKKGEFEPESVTYNNGSGTVTITNARIGRTAYRLGEGEQSRLEFSEVDFHIQVADLVIAGSAVTPVRGHRITWESRVYEVQAPPGEQPAYKDPFGIDWFIRTKRVT